MVEYDGNKQQLMFYKYYKNILIQNGYCCGNEVNRESGNELQQLLPVMYWRSDARRAFTSLIMDVTINRL